VWETAGACPDFLAHVDRQRRRVGARFARPTYGHPESEHRLGNPEPGVERGFFFHQSARIASAAPGSATLAGRAAFTRLRKSVRHPLPPAPPPRENLPGARW
jgi:hypothetical protein